MRVVVARLWESKRAEKLALIHPYDVDLNNRETLAEIQAINPTLDNAISHDIAAGSNAVAEILDKKLPGNGTDAQDAAKLLLMASLGSASGRDAWSEAYRSDLVLVSTRSRRVTSAEGSARRPND